MIKISSGTPLTGKNLSIWYKKWKDDLARLEESWRLYTNKKGKSAYLKMPFAKKLVLISAAATAGDGITISAPESLRVEQKQTFEEIQRLFKKQIIASQDLEVIKQGCIFGRGYELSYLSDDEVPVPKCTRISATNAFVVYDDTVEKNSIYGVYFDRFQEKSAYKLRFYIYDEKKKHTVEFSEESLNSDSFNEKIDISAGEEHNMGRMPLTEYLNNDEEQSDFEQVIDLMYDRTQIHNLNLKDMKDIAKNYLKGRNVEFAGVTDAEKAASRQKAADLQLIEVRTGDSSGVGDDGHDDITILSKNENYSSVDVFGRDIDSKIYDLSMIPNLADDQFAGNQSGVALELKLLAFKELVKAKDVYIERLYRRRLKMYIHALTHDSKRLAALDAGDIEITPNRTWTQNTAELASLITMLQPTGLFSDEYLTNMMPTADYREETDRKANEDKEKAKRNNSAADPNNASLEEYNALLRGLGYDSKG